MSRIIPKPCRPHMSHAPLLAAAILILAGCGSKAEDRPDPLVATVTVGAAAPGVRQLSGEVRAAVDSELSFRVGGQIVDRPVRRGQAVRRGQTLLRLDAEDLALGAAEAAARLRAAEQSVAAARAAATRAAADDARLGPLVGAGGISRQAHDAARAAADQAAAALAAAEAQAAAARAAAAQARNQQRHATLVADADGVVADLLAEPGQVVQPGQPVVRLARSGRRDAVVAVPEALRATLPREAEAHVLGDSRRFAASLRELAAAADPRTRSFEARYALTGAEDVPTGATVILKLNGAGDRTAPPRMSVPLGAIIDRGAGPGVWVVGPDQTVVLRPVRLAGLGDEEAIITAGLRPGERIVALGAHRLAAGQRIRPGPLPR
ncbi:MAG: efflux RND transporter periplasmic adaptor subunit [Sphingomonadaceae bacterium]